MLTYGEAVKTCGFDDEFNCFHYQKPHANFNTQYFVLITESYFEL